MKRWKQEHGDYITPGGDPIWLCPVCSGDRHIMGIETLCNQHNRCVECGELLLYPWEKDNELSI